MVLESIITPQEAEKRPLDMFLLGFAAASIGMWLAYGISKWLPTYVLPGHMNAWFLFFTTLALVYSINRVLRLEERKDTILSKGKFFGRHLDVFFVFLFVFLGITIAVSFWFTLLPQAMTNTIFGVQINEITRIRSIGAALESASAASGVMIGSGFATASLFQKITGMIINAALMTKIILLNNLRLVLLFVAFSFIFGAGAILLLSWNAAVIGVAMGIIIQQSIAVTASVLTKTTTYFIALPLSFTSFFVHGIFEMLGYFVAAVAGGIFSAAIVRKDHKTKYFMRIIIDVSWLVGAAVVLILVGGYIEAYITPLL